MKGIDQYIDFFRSERQRIDAGSQAVMNARREAAAEALQRLGFPTQKVERYKYTDVAAAFAPNYGISLAAASAPQHEEALISRYGTLARVEDDAITALRDSAFHMLKLATDILENRI